MEGQCICFPNPLHPKISPWVTWHHLLNKNYNSTLLLNLILRQDWQNIATFQPNSTYPSPEHQTIFLGFCIKLCKADFFAILLQKCHLSLIPLISSLGLYNLSPRKRDSCEIHVLKNWIKKKHHLWHLY